MKAVATLVLLLHLWTLCNTLQETDGPIVATIYGKVQGKYTDKAQVFTSIPYGTPPVGELRWKDPQPPKPWSDVLATVDDPPGCPQSIPCVLPLPKFLCPKRVSEDCLYLNVFTPLNANPTSQLPVMFFVHGGNFLRGYSGGFLYDGQYIANTSSTIVVTTNYRLGAIGFLVYGSGDGAPSGNYGLKDQRLALEWVRDNIANFGGDPNLVTLWGQSAGAVSAAIFMTSIKGSGLFNKVIMESEPFSIVLKDVDHAKKLGNDFAKAIGCGSVDCLFSKDITEIAQAQVAVLNKIIDLSHLLEVFLQWTPIVDGDEVLDQPLTLFQRGETASVPVIIGTTSQETIFFVYEGFPKPITVIEYDGLLLGIFGIQHFEEVRKRYPPPENDTRPEAAILSTDFTFTCPTRSAVRGFEKNVQAPIWLYAFNHSTSFDGWGTNFSFCNGHSCHGVELPFVFHTATLGGFNYTPAELQLTNSMVIYWTNFAHYGDPNGMGSRQKNGSPSLLNWPKYNAIDQYKCMRFRTPTSDVIINYLGSTCDFWDTIGYNV